MFILLLVVILLVFIFDFSKVVRAKKYSDTAFFLLVAAISIIYGYYYSTHVYTASIAGVILNIFGISH